MILALALGLLSQDIAPANERGARLCAFVVDVDGALLVNGWSVTVQHGGPRDRRSVMSAKVDAATGVVALADLSPGGYTVVAHGPQQVASLPFVLELAAGAEAEVELLYPSVDPSLQVAVVLRGKGMEGLAVEAVAPAGERTALAPRSKGGNVWAGAPSGDGPWRVTVSSHSHDEAAVDGVRRGQLTDIVLVRGAVLERVVLDLLVVDAASGAPLEHFEVDEFRSAFVGAQMLARATTPARTPGAVRFEGLVPGRCELVIRAEGRAVRPVTLPTTRAIHSATELRVELVPEFVVRGRVVDSEGAPMPGVKVAAVRGREVAPGPVDGAMSISPSGRGPDGGSDRSATSDAEGWFTFAGLWHAEHTFSADFGPGRATIVSTPLPLPRLIQVGADQTAPGRANEGLRRGLVITAADGVSYFELRCPPLARAQ